MIRQGSWATPGPLPAPPLRARLAVAARRHRRGLGGAAALVVLAALAWQLALHRLEAAVLQALGPRASVEQIGLGLAAVEIHGLRLRGDRTAGWPADDEARARRVTLVPDWRSVVGGLFAGADHAWRLRSVTVDGGQIVLLRGADGRLRWLPGLQRPATAAAGAPAAPGSAAAGLAAPRVLIDHLQVRDSAVDLFDASVRRPAHRVQLAGLQAEVGPLGFPQATQPTRLALRGRLVGPQHDGTLALDGTLHFATRDADLQARLQGVDLLALQPYLIRAGEGGIRGGRLDLQLDAQVRQQRLHAPGTLTLTGLALSGGDSLAGLLAGVPRQAVLATMRRDGRITLKFSLDGRLDDPAFSINESLARRVAGGLAEAVGVSLSGMVDGVGGLIKGLLGR